MKILFISQLHIDLADKGIYSDLINELLTRGHKLTLIEATSNKEKGRFYECGCDILKIKVGEQYGVNLLKKGIVLLTLNHKIKSGIKKYLLKEQFDLVIYATPPITIAGSIKYCKKKFGCKSYLMLKDIFPQNAIDIGLMSDKGILGLVYKFFKYSEKNLYKVSDRIGCMSPANMSYIEKNNHISEDNLEIFPNALSLTDIKVKPDTDILCKYGIPVKPVKFIYGGNLGLPQGLDFLADAIKATQDIEDAYFIIVGKGSEKTKLFNKLKGINNVKCIESLPHNEYDKLCNACDIGMVMLDYRFTIPNFPSRTLSYLINAKPIFACTDKATDIKELVEDKAVCGKWCYSNDINEFKLCIDWFVENKHLISKLGENGYKYFKDNFTTEQCADKLEAFIKEKNRKMRNL